MRWFWIVVLVGGLLGVPGCTHPFMDGAGLLPKYSAPIGAYFVKPGMTREERLRDLAACGTHDGLLARISEEDAKKASESTNEFISSKVATGYIIMRRKFESCMASKGYYRVPSGACSGDQEYFPQCMWP